MTVYQLSIEIDSQGLNLLNQDGQFVTFVQSVGSGRPVVWVSFQPSNTNTVTWTDSYSVYASTSPFQNGAQIFTQSTQPAAGGNIYTLNGGQFDNGQPGLPATQFGVANDDPSFNVNGVQMVTSGLYQEAIVNGSPTASPLNAVGIPYQESATFTPIQGVQVVASPFQNNGVVIDSVSALALLVDLTQGPMQTIHFDDTAGQFVMGSLPSGDRTRKPKR
jgi:hypothetical protein